MDTWKITQTTKKLPKLNNPIMIEGLPGIGNVGKVAVDFMIEELKAEKIYDVFSYTFPHSVFVNEDNLVELPTIEVHYKKMPRGNDLILVSGDVQPIDEVSSYKFSDRMLDLLEQYKGNLTEQARLISEMGLSNVELENVITTLKSSNSLSNSEEQTLRNTISQLQNENKNKSNLVWYLVGVFALILIILVMILILRRKK